MKSLWDISQGPYAHMHIFLMFRLRNKCLKVISHLWSVQLRHVNYLFRNVLKSLFTVMNQTATSAKQVNCRIIQSAVRASDIKYYLNINMQIQRIRTCKLTDSDWLDKSQSWVSPYNVTHNHYITLKLHKFNLHWLLWALIISGSHGYYTSIPVWGTQQLTQIVQAIY